MPLLEDAPPRLRAPLRQVTTLAATSLWIAPAVAATIAVVLAWVLVAWDPTLSWLPLGLEDGDAARTGLSAVITSTVAAVSLVGTGTIVALQLASAQFSPRLLRGVLDDDRLQWSLAGLVGVVVYALLVLAQVRGDDAPAVAVALGLLAGVVAVGLLVMFVHRITFRMRLESILDEITTDGLGAVDDTYPRDADAVDLSVPDYAVALRARRSGYIQALSLDALAEAAASHGVHVRLRLPVGEFQVDGTTVAWVWPASGDRDAPTDATHEDLEAAVDRSLALGIDRTVEGDPAYALRHIVDVGLRGVSPSVNDPTTTQQCIHHATRVLVELASRPLHDGRAEEDGCRAMLPQPRFADHLELAQAQLLQYGGHDARVVAALATQLRDLAEATTADRDLLEDHLERLRASIGQHEHQPHDRDVVERALHRVEEALDGRADDDDPPAS